MTTRAAGPSPAEPPAPAAAPVAPPPIGAIVAVATLVALPLLVYGLPALLGHTVVPGDDLTQNLPLRALVGRDLDAGHLPIFDPYLWSGSPLLGGWNAGAAYPLTWLFAILPETAAWTLNFVAAAAVAGVGTYAFLRASRLGVLASWAGGLTYAFGGAMAAQAPHIGLITGMSWVPVAMLAIAHLTRPGPHQASAWLGWTAALGASVGLVVLSGEPRAVSDAAAVLVLYGAWRIWRVLRRERRIRAALGVVAGGALGIGLGAVQLLPGLAAAATSQRAVVSVYLFSAGSLPVRWMSLLGIPDLLGGSGSLGQPRFLAGYNLTEVTAYVGVLPLVAAFALFARAKWHDGLPEWLIWEVTAAAGILLALGNHTPLWHVLIHVPLFGDQRLQSRSLLVTDLALAVLLAYWVDGLGSRRRAERVLGSVPAVCIAGMVVAALVVGVPFFEWMGVPGKAAGVTGSLGPWLVASLALAALALALVWVRGRASPRVWRAGIAALVVVDLATFAFTTVVEVGGDRAPTAAAPTAAAPTAAAPVAPARAAHQAPTSVRPVSALHLRGRFAVYDPDLSDPSQLRALGVPDTNVVDRTSSVQGYSSLADRRYARATGAHAVSGTGQDTFSPEAAVDGVLDQLATEDVFTLPKYVVRRAGSANGGTARTGDVGTRRLVPGRRAAWELGTPLAVTSARLTIRATSGATGTGGATGAGSTPVPRVGLVTARGRVEWGQTGAPRAEVGRRARGTHIWRVTWKVPVRAVSLVVGSPSRGVAGAPVVTLGSGRRVVLDGALQDAMAAPHWVYAGRDGAFVVYRDRRERAPLTLRAGGDGGGGARAGASLVGASVRRLSGTRLDPSSAAVDSAHGVDVVRAVADIPGWTATWAPAGGGGVQREAVRRDGVVQVVHVPAGPGVLTWHYTAPDLSAGMLVSGASLLVLLVLVGAGVGCEVRGRRRRAGRAVGCEVRGRRRRAGATGATGATGASLLSTVVPCGAVRCGDGVTW